MAFTYVTVTCDYDLGDGTDPSGTVTFTPTAPMVNGGVVNVAAPVSRRVDVDGQLSISLAANTDTATAPTGAAYLVTEQLNNVTRTYYVSIPHDQGSTVALSSLATVGAAPALSFPPASGAGNPGRFDVTTYGAAGNGTTDDTTPIAAAITAAHSVGNGTVWFPAGTYKITSSLSAYSNLTYAGAGRGQVTIAAGTTLTTAMIVGASGDTVTRWALDGISLDGGWATNSDSLRGVQITNGSEISIRNCRFTNIGDAGVLLQGLSTNGGTPHSDVTGNLFDGIGQADGTTGCGILIKDASTHCRVAGNDLRNIKGGMGISANGSGGTGYPTHMAISDNTIVMTSSTTGFEGIGLTASCDYATITGNNISTTFDNGISYSAARGTIVGNVIDGTYNHGIAIVGAGTTVTGNVIRNVGQQNDAAYGGITITTGGKCIVLGNTIVDDQGSPTMSHGIKLITSAGTNFVGLNTISGATVSAFTGIVTGDLQLDITTQTNGVQIARTYTDDIRPATGGSAGTFTGDWRSTSRHWIGSNSTSSGGQLNVFSNAGSTRPTASFNSAGAQTTNLWQCLASDLTTVVANCTVTGRIVGVDGVTSRELGDVTGLTSAQIDALFTATPANGTLATGLISSTPVGLHRRNGKWNSVNLSVIT